MTGKLLTAAVMASLTVGAAYANPLGFGGNKTAEAAQAAPVSAPEIDAANQKCEQLSAKLNQAKKQLEAAKANLKAAESELRAARADKEALGLRSQATELASKAAIDPIVGSGQTTNGLGVAPAASADAPVVHQIDNGSPVPGSGVTTTTTTTTVAPSTANAPTLQDLAPN